MEEKYFMNCKDIMELFRCGKNKAYGIINSIKMVSDTCGISGKITRPDFEKWYNLPLKKDNADCTNENVRIINQDAIRKTSY